MNNHHTLSSENLNEIATFESAVVEAGTAESPVDTATVTPTEAASLELSPAQQVAIVKLTSGFSRRDAALAAGVDRRTVYRWLSDDVHFQAAYNAWHRDVTNTVQMQLLAASQDALNTVVKSIRNGNSRLAWELLKTQGMHGSAKFGSTDAAELQRQQQMAQKKKQIADHRERSQMETDEIMANVR